MAVHCRASSALCKAGTSTSCKHALGRVHWKKRKLLWFSFSTATHTKKGLPCVWNKREHIPSRHKTNPCYKHKVNAILVLEAGQLPITVFIEGFVVHWLECFCSSLIPVTAGHKSWKKMALCCWYTQPGTSTASVPTLVQVHGCKALPWWDLRASAGELVLPSPSHTYFRHQVLIQPSKKASTYNQCLPPEI